MKQLNEKSDLDNFSIYIISINIIPINDDIHKNRSNYIYPYQMRGILLNWTKKISPQLGNYLHSKDSNIMKIVRPYTIRYVLNGNGIKVPSFQIITYSNNFADAIFKYIIDVKNNSNIINLGKLMYAIVSVNFEVYNLINLFDEADEWLKSIASENKVPSFKLSFIRPTAFKSKSKRKLIYMPEPSYIMSNLTNQWHSIFNGTKYDTPRDLFKWLVSHTKINNVHIRIKSERYSKSNKGKSNFTGFVGNAKYIITKKSFDHLRWAYILFRFGEFMGCGKGRTEGFGMYKLYV